MDVVARILLGLDLHVVSDKWKIRSDRRSWNCTCGMSAEIDDPVDVFPAGQRHIAEAIAELIEAGRP